MARRIRLVNPQLPPELVLSDITPGPLLAQANWSRASPELDGCLRSRRFVWVMDITRRALRACRPGPKVTTRRIWWLRNGWRGRG
jgi:hypothetical protein